MFLETKCYDHPRFESYIADQETALLSIQREQVDEQWLKDLHFHLIVLADAAEAVGPDGVDRRHEVSCERVLASILDRKITEPDALISAYADYDATAALRLARLLRLDVVCDAPEVVITHADQPLFLALVLEELPSDEPRALDYANTLVQRGIQKILLNALHDTLGF